MADIGVEEMKQDILDTQREIEVMEREIKGYEMIRDKMSMFRADARRSGIRERKEFIVKVEALLKEKENL